MEYIGQDTRQLISVRGNIFDSDAQCLVNPVNTVGIMGAGLALEFKKRYPSMYESYKEFCKTKQLKVGQIIFYQSTEYDKIICLFPTKEHWKQSSQLSHIERGLMAFKTYYVDAGITSVAFPKLGCGLGGLNWDYHVQPLMEQYLSPLPIQVELYI